MALGNMGEPAPVSTWLLGARRTRRTRARVVFALVVLLEIGILLAAMVLAKAFFPR